jgi:hypothetical protein
MADWEIALRSVDGDRNEFVPLLIEADESESVVRAYLNEGELLEIVANGQPVGVVLLTSPEPAAIEIKNIAIGREYRATESVALSLRMPRGSSQREWS